MNTEAAIDARAASFEDELLELLCSEQDWIDAIFAEIIEQFATRETVRARLQLDRVWLSGSTHGPSSPGGQRPGAIERSPPGRPLT